MVDSGPQLVRSLSHMSHSSAEETLLDEGKRPLAFVVWCLVWFCLVFLFGLGVLVFFFPHHVVFPSFNDDLDTPPTWRPHSWKKLHALVWCSTWPNHREKAQLAALAMGVVALTRCCIFFHEYGRRVGMVPRSSLKERKYSQMVEKRTKTTQQQTKQNQPQPTGRDSTIK